MHGVAVRLLAEQVGDGFRKGVVEIGGGGSTSHNDTSRRVGTTELQWAVA